MTSDFDTLGYGLGLGLGWGLRLAFGFGLGLGFGLGIELGFRLGLVLGLGRKKRSTRLGISDSIFDICFILFYLIRFV